MSPEIGSSRQFIERRGGPAYDWDQTTLILDSIAHILDLSSIVPIGAVWVKFHLIITASPSPRIFQLLNNPSINFNWSAYGVTRGTPSIANLELFLKLSSPQSCYYLVQTGITALTVRVLGWML